MDQAKISQHIAALLISHDCVIVPAFGGFVANRAPARINRFNDRFDPPYRKISFNKLLTHNDGLLASYVARHESSKYEEALATIQACARQLEKQLNSDKRLTLEGVGTLSKLSDGSIRFEQDREAGIALSEFGLESFFSRKVERQMRPKPIVEPKTEVKQGLIRPEEPTDQPEPAKVIPLPQEATEEKTEAAQESPSPAADAEEREDKKRVIWPVAAALALPIAAYATWLVLGANVLSADQRFHHSDLNPFTEKVCPEYQVRSARMELSSLPAESLAIDPATAESHIEIYKNDRDKTLVVSMEKNKVGLNKAIDLRYHIIGGCFSNLANAESMVRKFQSAGSNASIVGQKSGLYRVSVASFATKKEAREALTSMRSEISNAWLLYK